MVGVDGISGSLIYLGEYDNREQAEKQANEYKVRRGRAFVIPVEDAKDKKVVMKQEEEVVEKKSKRGRKKKVEGGE